MIAVGIDVSKSKSTVLLIVSKISHFLDKQDLVILTKAPLLAHF